MLDKLVELMGVECQNAIEHELFGTQQFHIEQLERIPSRGDAMLFRVTTWSEMADEPRITREIDLFDLMHLIGRVIAARAMGPAVTYLQSLPEADAHVVELD